MCKNLLNSFVSALAVAGVLSLSHSAIAMSDELDDSKTSRKRPRDDREVSDNLSAAYNRPPEVEEAVSVTYGRRNHSESDKSLYGSPCRGGIDDYKVLLGMVRTAPKGRKDFNVLELEADRKFCWGNWLFREIIMLEDFPPDVKVKVVSVKAPMRDYWKTEREDNSKTLASDYGTLQQIGNFNVENLSSELLEHELPASYDMIFTPYKCIEYPNHDPFSSSVNRVTLETFGQLSDPVGTFLQAYNSLRPGGIMIFTSFTILDEGEKPEGKGYGKHRVPLLLGDLGIPYLVSLRRLFSLSELDNLVVRKVHAAPVTLPWEYKGTLLNYPSEGFDEFSLLYYTRYGVPSQYKGAKYSRSLQSHQWGLCGDQELYNDLAEHGALRSKNYFDQYTEVPPFLGPLGVPPYLGPLTFDYPDMSE